jgi:hypothetical protein
MTYWSPDLAHIQRVNAQGQRLHYRFRYDPADISRIALFQDDRWIGDVTAKELRQPDGSLIPLSLWERNLSKQLACAAGQPATHWLRFIYEIDTLSQQRLKEKKRTRRKGTRSVTEPDARATEAAMTETELASTYQEYTELLARFMETQEDTP